MQSKLTNALVKNALPESRDVSITDTLLPGFELRIRPSGNKAWTFRYRTNAGRQQRLKLGSYPAVFSLRRRGRER